MYVGMACVRGLALGLLTHSHTPPSPITTPTVFARPLTGSGSDLLLGGLAPAGGVVGGAAGTKKSHKRSAGAAFPRAGGAGLAQAGSDSSLSATAAEWGNANKRKR